MVEAERYIFRFWDRVDREGINGNARDALEKMGCLADYSLNGGGFTKTFEFPAQEKELFNHVRDFKQRLVNAIVPSVSA